MNQKLVVLLMVVVVLVLSATLISLKPYAHIESRDKMTDVPDQQVWGLVNSGASLDSITAQILKTGKDVDDFHGISGSLLSRAVKLQRYDLVNWLLRNGADPNGSGYSPTPLWMAVSMTQDADMVRLLIEKGASSDVEFGDGVSLLDIAKNEGDPEIILIIENAIKKRSEKKP